MTSNIVNVNHVFTKETYPNRRLELKKCLKSGIMLFLGNEESPMNYVACMTIINGLKDINLMKGDTEEALASGAHAMFFPCGTGHMMGLDVHDMEDLGEVYIGYDGQPKSTQFGLKSLRLARLMEEGFVATIEPGIYFIPELIAMWKKDGINASFINFRNVEAYSTFSGIRNEEDIVITKDGYRVLGKRKPKTIDEVESLR